MDWADSAYVATEDSGQATGFFCYSVNTEDNIGFLKYVIVDKTKRGKGYGKSGFAVISYRYRTDSVRSISLIRGRLSIFP